MILIEKQEKIQDEKWSYKGIRYKGLYKETNSFSGRQVIQGRVMSDEEAEELPRTVPQPFL